MALLTGCAVGPKYDPPVVDVPCEWHAQPSGAMQIDSPDCFVWWEALNDPILNSLIQRAAVQNLDVYMAVNRVLQARLGEKGGRYAFYPHLDASAVGGAAQYNQKTLNHLLGISSSCTDASKDHQQGFYEFGFDAEWEIDLFGMQAHQLNALKAKVESSQQQLCHVWISLSAEIAKNYIELRGFQQRLEILKSTIEEQKENVQLVKSLVQGGFGNSVDISRAEQLLSSIASQKPELEFLVNKSIYRLSVLLGYLPGDLYPELCQAVPLPALPCNKPIGIPSELLRRRPDIQKAERDLAAATEQVGSAVAALFPRLSLTGFVGDIAALCSGSLTWYAAPQLLIPVFNSRLLENDVDFNKIEAQQALYIYQKTVLEALEESENAIAALDYGIEKNRQLADSKKASEESSVLISQLYGIGMRNYLEVLESSRTQFAAQDAYLQSNVEVLLNYIALYKALGGAY